MPSFVILIVVSKINDNLLFRYVKAKNKYEKNMITSLLIVV